MLHVMILISSLGITSSICFLPFRCGRKKGEITALLRHIEGRVASIEQKKSNLIDEIQLAVDMVCTLGFQIYAI